MDSAPARFAKQFAFGMGLAAAVPAMFVTYMMCLFFGLVWLSDPVETFHHPIVDGTGLDALVATERVVLNNDYGPNRVHLDTTDPELIDVFVTAIQGRRHRGRPDWPSRWDAAEVPSLLRKASPHGFSCRFYIGGEIRKAWNFDVPSPRTLRWTFRSSREHPEIPESGEYVFAGPLTPKQEKMLLWLHTFGQRPDRVHASDLGF